MKHIITGFSLIGAFALLALAVGCAGTQTQSKENLLIAAGFKTVVPKTAAQQQKLQALPPDKVAMVQKGGKTYYVFPDAANNRALVGGPKQYQAYQQLEEPKTHISFLCLRSWQWRVSSPKASIYRG